MGRRAEARQTFAQSQVPAVELDDPRLHEASAGLVRAALPEGDTAAAQAALRQGYLENIPWNREIVAAWAQRAV